MTYRTSTYRTVADAAWRWVLAHVQRTDGAVAIPVSVPGDVEPEWRDGMHSGVGGLAYALAEIRLARPWTDEEHELAAAIAKQERAGVADCTDVTFFNGLVSKIGVLTVLNAPGAVEAVARLTELATPDGWDAPFLGPPRYLPGARIHDAVLGTAGVLLGALWARRHGATGAQELTEQAIDLLLAESFEVPTGVDWYHVPARFRPNGPTQAPNFSHGTAGIATALALAGSELDRPDLIDTARRGAEHLITLNHAPDGFSVPTLLPPNGEPAFSYGWCHGPTGTSLLFLALQHAGVTTLSGLPPTDWYRRCLHTVRTSGLPARLRPGFWDNDGRCCGTAGVGEAFLHAWQRDRHEDDLKFAVELADALVERAERDGDHAYWRFIEHKNEDPLLPPGVGWMQGAAGIAAHLHRVARVLDEGPDAPVVARMDDWWTRPTQ